MNELVKQNTAIAGIFNALTGPAHERLVVLATISKAIAAEEDKLKTELLAQMDGSYVLAAFDTHTVQRCKAPARWEYVYNEDRIKFVARIDLLKAELKEMEKTMQKNGEAVDENEEQYIIRITEKKLTMEEK